MPNTDSYQAKSAESRARRDQWVDARLLDVFMHNSYSGTPLRIAIVLTTSILLWQEIDHTAVLAWLALALALIFVRHYVYTRYLKLLSLIHI